MKVKDIFKWLVVTWIGRYLLFFILINIFAGLDQLFYDHTDIFYYAMWVSVGALGLQASIHIGHAFYNLVRGDKNFKPVEPKPEPKPDNGVVVVKFKQQDMVEGKWGDMLTKLRALGYIDTIKSSKSDLRIEISGTNVMSHRDEIEGISPEFGYDVISFE